MLLSLPQILFKAIQRRLAWLQINPYGNNLGTERIKRKRPSIDIQSLSRFTCTQSRYKTVKTRESKEVIKMLIISIL